MSLTCVSQPKDLAERYLSVSDQWRYIWNATCIIFHMYSIPTVFPLYAMIQVSWYLTVNLIDWFLSYFCFKQRTSCGASCPIIHEHVLPQTTKFMGPTWGPPGPCRPQMGPMLAPWTSLSGACVVCEIGVIIGSSHGCHILGSEPSLEPILSLIARLMGPTWGPMGPMLAPWTLLSGLFCQS